MKEIAAVLSDVSGPIRFSLEILDQINEGVEVNMPVCLTLARIFLELAADKLAAPAGDGPRQGDQDMSRV